MDENRVGYARIEGTPLGTGTLTTTWKEGEPTVWVCVACGRSGFVNGPICTACHGHGVTHPPANV